MPKNMKLLIPRFSTLGSNTYDRSTQSGPNTLGSSTVFNTLGSQYPPAPTIPKENEVRFHITKKSKPTVTMRKLAEVAGMSVESGTSVNGRWMGLDGMNRWDEKLRKEKRRGGDLSVTPAVEGDCRVFQVPEHCSRIII